MDLTVVMGHLPTEEVLCKDAAKKEEALCIVKCSFVLNPQEDGYPIESASNGFLHAVDRKRKDVIGESWNCFVVKIPPRRIQSVDIDTGYE